MSKKKPRCLEGLNPAQAQAVTHHGGPVLVISGAGTGKTTTVGARVAYLIDKGVLPERILLLTFTRRAAQEMLDKAGLSTSQALIRRVCGGTFHSVASRLLRQYGRAIGLPANFTIMDAEDAAALMNLIRTELDFGSTKRRFPKKDTLAAIHSRMANTGQELEHVLRDHFAWCLEDIEDIQAIFDRYRQRKKDQHLLDFDDLLLRWVDLCDHPAIGSKLVNLFDHILVDEYQDTNIVQGEILQKMRSENKNIMVVGDDAQSVYSFRGATVQNILDFPKDFPGAKIVKLEQNYRSTQPILAAANAVIAEAREGYDKKLWSDRTSDQKPVLFTCMDQAQESQQVCDTVLKHLEQGVPLKKQAVLFRAGYHSGQLEIELTKRNIPFRKFGGIKFIEAAHIKDMLALLRILENPFDELSWHRVLQLLDGIGPKTAHRILAGIGVGNGVVPKPGLEEALSDGVDDPLNRLFASPPIVPGAARREFQQLCAALKECRDVEPSSDGEVDSAEESSSFVRQIEITRRFYEPILERVYEYPDVRKRDLEQLESIASGYRSRSQFIIDLTLDPPTATSDLARGTKEQDDDYLVLSTIHSAKGLEWKAVHIINAVDGMLPSDKSLGEADGLEEERRLCYVAMTRAADRLYVYFPLSFYRQRNAMTDSRGYAQLSRFLTPAVRARFEQRTFRGDARGVA